MLHNDYLDVKFARSTQRNVQNLIEHITPFTNYGGTMRAERNVEYQDGKPVRIEYTIYSYAEPIGRVTVDIYDDGQTRVKTFVNPTKYSRTTSRHQGYVRRALALLAL